MLDVVTTSLGTARWPDFLNPEVLRQLQGEKPILVRGEVVNFQPLLPGVRVLGVDIDPTAVRERLSPNLDLLTERTIQLIDNSGSTLRQGRQNLIERGFAQMTLDDLRGVVLLGGNAQVPWMMDAIELALRQHRLSVDVHLLEVPRSISARGWTDVDSFRLSAVAIGASRSSLPAVSLLGADSPQSRGSTIGPADKEWQ